jgi:hypothetical protein
MRAEMKRFFPCIILAFVMFVPAALSAASGSDRENNTSQTTRDWHFSAAIVYTSRTLGGSIAQNDPLFRNTYGSMLATTDSMNLNKSDSFMYTLAVQYRRWGVALNYGPTSFSGQGSALVGLDNNTTDTGLLHTTPLTTAINIDLLLGKFTYDIVQSKNSRFGVGIGLGESFIDLHITPDVGKPIAFSGTEPFAYASIYMQNRYEAFLYGFNLNGISATFSGTKIDYSDYTVDLGYRLSDDTVKWDVIGGYRLVNFTISMEDQGENIKAVTQLQGPFVGLSISY